MRFFFLLVKACLHSRSKPKVVRKELLRTILLYIRKRRRFVPEIRYLHSTNLAVLYTYKTAFSLILRPLLVKEKGSLPPPPVHDLLPADPKIGEDYQVMTVVRNPLERLVCCYRRKIENPKKPGGFLKSVYLGGYLGDCNSFEEFAKMVLAIPNRLLDPHIALMSDVIFDEAGQSRAQIILRYETLYEDWVDLQQSFSLPDLGIKKTPNPQWQDAYTLELAEAVAKKYWKDIEAFGYQQDYEDLIAYLKIRKNSLDLEK